MVLVASSGGGDGMLGAAGGANTATSLYTYIEEILAQDLRLTHCF